MNDEELIAAIRRTLRSRASAIRPRPRAAARPLPQLSRPGRNRRPLALMAAAGLMAAGDRRRRGHRADEADTRQPHRDLPTPHRRRPHRRRPHPWRSRPPSLPPATTPTSKPDTATTTAPPPPRPVPADFQPLSVTFVSSTAAWVLGTVPCGLQTCPDLAQTTDDGLTWTTERHHASVSPSLQGSDLSTGWSVQVRQRNGLVGSTPPDPNSRRPACGRPMTEAAPGRRCPIRVAPQSTSGTWKPPSGVAQARTRIGAGSRGRADLHRHGGGRERRLGSPSPTTLGVGAGAVATAQVVIQGPTGCIIDNNLVVTGGARIKPDRRVGPLGRLPAPTPWVKASLAASSDDRPDRRLRRGHIGSPGSGHDPQLRLAVHLPRRGHHLHSRRGRTRLPGPSGVTAAPGVPSTIVAARTAARLGRHLQRRQDLAGRVLDHQLRDGDLCRLHDRHAGRRRRLLVIRPVDDPDDGRRGSHVGAGEVLKRRISDVGVGRFGAAGRSRDRETTEGGRRLAPWHL